MIVNRNRAGQGLAGTLASLLGGDLPVAIRAYDDSYADPSDASATLVIRPVHVRSSAQRRGSTTRVSRRYGYRFAKVRISNLLEQQSWSEHD
jgi:hypothetical protein